MASPEPGEEWAASDEAALRIPFSGINRGVAIVSPDLHVADLKGYLAQFGMDVIVSRYVPEGSVYICPNGLPPNFPRDE